MQPPKVQASSLVFVAIVASWAAYLLPRWVLRRDTLGQARGRDRHSANLRVLTRRRRPRSTRASSAPLLTARPAAGPHPATAPARHRTAGHPAAPAAAPAAPVTAAGPATVAAAAPRPDRHLAARRAAARRARVLAVLLVLTAGSAAVVPLAHTPLWTPAPASGLLLLDLVGLVVTGRRRAVARRAMAHEVALRTLAARRRVEAARPQRPAVPAARFAEPAESAATDLPARDDAAVAGRESAGRESARRLVPVPALSPVAAGLSGPSWTPVAVPPPTYTLKPVARRAEPRPLDLPAPAAPRPWDVDPVTERPWADDLDLDLVLARRRAVNG